MDVFFQEKFTSNFIFNQKNFKGAIADYDKSLEFNPWNYNVWYNRTLCRIEDKEYERAQADLDTMVNRWKTNAKAYSLKAEVFLMQKDTTKADEWLGKSLDIDPYNADAWSAKAMIGLSRSEWSEAAACLDKAIHLKPQNVPNYVNRGLARYNLNNLRGAMADYDKAIDLDPNNFMARYNRGLLGMQLGDDNRAITDFDYVIRMEPDNVMAIFNRALLHDRTGDLKSAIKDYTTVINQFPNFWTGLARRAACYRRLGMTAKAELDEFKILKAQMDKHQGKQPRWSASKTKQMRKRSDIDPEKYNQIVVADENKVEHEYESDYRGRVQNRSVEQSFRPMYFLAMSPYDNGVKSYQAFSAAVDRFNSNARDVRHIYVNCISRQLDQKTSQGYFEYVDSLSAGIDASRNISDVKADVLVRSVVYSALQNYDAAVSDLTTYLSIDSLSPLGYWQRAFCLSKMNEFNASGGTDVRIAAERAMADMNQAIRLDSDNQYLFYNRGNMYAAGKLYDKAIADYTEAIRLDANLAEAYYNRGLAHINNKNVSAGIADLSKAGELGLYDAYSLIKKYQQADKKTG